MPGASTAAQTALFLRKLSLGPLPEEALLLLHTHAELWACVHPSLTEEYKAFRSACLGWQSTDPEHRTPATWQAVVDAGNALASPLGKHGNELLPVEPHAGT